MIQSLPAIPHAKISTNSNDEFSKLSILRVQSRWFSLQSDRIKRNAKPVCVIRQCRRNFECFDVSIGLLQDQTWRWNQKQQKKKQTGSNCYSPVGDSFAVREDEDRISNWLNKDFCAKFLFLMLTFYFLRWEEPIGPPHIKFERVTYSTFVSKIEHDQVQKVEVDGNHIRFKLKEIDMSEIDESITKEKEIEGWAEVLKKMEPTQPIVYYTIRPNDIKTPYKKMAYNGVEFGSRDELWKDFDFFGMTRSFCSLLWFILIGSALCWIYRCLPDNFSREYLKEFQTRFQKEFQHTFAELKTPKSKQGEAITFADVGGVHEAKEELKEIVEFFRHLDWYMRLGVRPPRAVLLVGLPGTGKTLLAKAVAGEADVPLISCSANEFGLGPSRVRDIFAKARKEAPSIIFIDEIDAVGKSEHENTLNQLLSEMDGLDSSSTVIVLGATSRPDALHPALRCPGRFDGVVMVETPDRLGREAILEVHVSNKELPVGEDVDYGEIASMTTGFTGADLANVVNKAALLARRVNKVIVERTEFIQAVERSVAGMEKNTILRESERAVAARHEAGHAVIGTAVGKLLPKQPCVEKLSILPRLGEAFPFIYTPPTYGDRYVLFIDELRGRMVTLLGGRAAEEVYLGCVSTRALDDTRRATNMAYKAVAEYYQNENVDSVSVTMLSGSRGSDQGHLVDLIQKEVKALLQSALEVALSVVHANSTVLEGLGTHLEGKEKIEGEELQEWLKLVVAPEELSIFITDISTSGSNCRIQIDGREEQLKIKTSAFPQAFMKYREEEDSVSFAEMASQD